MVACIFPIVGWDDSAHLVLPSENGSELEGAAKVKYCRIQPSGNDWIVPTCKRWTKLTKHHDKHIDKVIILCRDCHSVIEEYVKDHGEYEKMFGY